MRGTVGWRGRGFYEAACLHSYVLERVCVFVWVECLIRLMRHGEACSNNITHRSQFTLLHINIYSHFTLTVKTLPSEPGMKRQRSALKLEEKGGGGKGKHS